MFSFKIFLNALIKILNMFKVSEILKIDKQPLIKNYSFIYFFRPISILPTYIFYKLKFTPNQITLSNATGNFTCPAITAGSATTKMGAVITYQDNAGTNALNTDIILQLSADNGSNFTTATLTALPDFSSGIKMAKVNDLSVTAGTQLKYKILFANQAQGSKEARIRGVSLNY